jgi:hypothetical protein
MEIENVKIKDLSLHPDNPRQGDIGAIAVSIEENGWYGTVVAQKSTGTVLAGNHRLQAAQQLGIKEVPVYWVDVNDIEARKILIADNRTNDLASYDDEALAEILTELALTDDLLGTGFDGDDLDFLLKDLELTDKEEANSDRNLEGLPEVTINEPDLVPENGTVWQLGPHVLVVCKDLMTDWSQWKNLLKGDAMFIPYAGPFTPLVAPESPKLVMVQPNTLVASHILHNWNDVKEPATQIESNTK